MVTKKFIQRHCVHKVLCSSLAHSPRAAVLVAEASEGSSSSSSSAPLSLGVQEASVMEKAPPARTSTSVPTLWKEEDLAAAPAVDLVSVPPVDAALMGVDLIVLSSDNEDKVDWEALVAEDEVNWEAIAAKDIDNVESMGSWSPSRI
jgi:hypothetical protein